MIEWLPNSVMHQVAHENGQGGGEAWQTVGPLMPSPLTEFAVVLNAATARQEIGVGMLAFFEIVNREPSGLDDSLASGCFAVETYEEGWRRVR